MKPKYCFVSYRISRRLCLPGILPMVVALALATPHARAASGSWNPTAAGTYDWATAGNWTGGIPNAAADVATITPDLAGAQTINLGANRTVTDLNLGDSGTATAFGFTIAPGVAGSTLILAGAAPSLDVSGAAAVNTISAPIQLQGAGSFRSTTTSEVVLSGVISNNGTLRNMAFNNDLNGTATAAASLQGQFALNAANTAGGATGTVAISDVRVRATVAGAFGANAANAVTVTGAGQAYLSAGTHVNNFNLNGTGWVETSGNFGAMRIENATVSGAVTMQQNSRIACNSGNAGTISGALTGAYTLTKNGTGALVLTGANRYGGITYVTDGQLRFGSATAMGYTPTVVVSSGRDATTSVQLNGGFAFGAGRSLILRNGANNNRRAELGNTANNNSWEGSILLESPTAGVRNQTLNSASGTTLTINGTITNSATLPSAGMFVRGVGNGVINGTFSLGDALLLKTDTGTWTINSTGNSQGSTTVAVGGLVVNNTDALQPGKPLIMGQSDANSSTLTINSGFSQNFSTITVLGGGSGAFNITGAGSLDTGAAGIPLTVNDTSAADDLTLSTAVTGAGGFARSGAGTLNLNGTTITGPVALAGGTTRGNATFNGGLSMDATSMLMPGSATAAGTFTTSTLALNGGTLAVNLGSNGSDVISVTTAGGLTQSGTTTIAVTPNGGFNPGSAFYPIITYTGASPGTAGFSLVGTLPGRMVGTIADISGAIGISATTERIVWTGASGPAYAWDNSPNMDWKKVSDGSPTSFLAQDDVLFNNDGIAQNTIALTGTIDPVRVEFAHTGGTYTLASGTLSGSGIMPLIQSGTGTTILQNANTYTGATTINAGTLELDNDGGTMTATAGVSVAAAATFRITDDDGAITFNRPLSGAGTVRINPHTLVTGTTTAQGVTLSGSAVGFTGSLILEAPQIGSSRVIASAAAVGSAAITVENENQLYIATGNTYANNIAITGNGFDDSLGSIGALRSDGGTWNGNIAISGTAGNSGGTASDARIGGAGGTTTINGSLSGGDASFWTYGTTSSTFVLTNANTHGDTIIGGADNISTAAGTVTVVLGDTGATPANTTATFGTGNVYMVTGDNTTTTPMAVTLRIRRADGYALPGNILGSSTVSANLSRLTLQADTTGTGLMLNNKTIDLSDGTAGGLVRVAVNNTGAALNIAGTSVLDVGSLHLGEASGYVGTVDQTGGTTTIINQLRVGHFPNNTSVYNLANGSVSITAANPATNPFGASGAEQNGGIYVGLDGVGVFNQSGGTVNTNWVVLDNRGETPGVDQYNLTGGTLNLKNTWGISGNPLTVLTLGGGTLAIDNAGPIDVPVSVPVTISGTGSILETTVAGNSFTFSKDLGGTGTLTTQGGGTLNLSTTGIQTVTPLIAGTSPVTKLGTGTTTLAAVSTYSGATTVSVGRLNLTGSLANSDVTVNNLAALGGEGSAKTITLGTAGTDTTTLFADATTAGTLTSTGTLAVNGTVNVSLVGTPASGGDTVTVLTHGGTAATTSNFALVNAATYRGSTFTVTGSAVVVDIDSTDLAWNGTTATWEIAGADGDWNTDDEFFNGDRVSFGDLAAATQAIAISGAVQPASVTFSNTAATAYTLTGAAGNGITGSALISKTGIGTVTLGGDNSFTGGIQVNAGTLILGAATGFGTTNSIAIANGAQVNLNGQTPGNTRVHSYLIAGDGPDDRGALINETASVAANAGVVNVTLTDNAVVGAYGGTGDGFRMDIGFNGATGGTINGNGFTLTKKGNAMVNVRGASTNISYVVAEGVMRAETNSLALGSTGVTVNSGATLDTYGGLTFDLPVLLNSGSTLTSTNGTANWNGMVTLEGDVTMGGAGTAVIAQSLAETGTGLFTKTGAGTIVLPVANTFTRKFNVAGGILRIGTDDALGTAPAAPLADAITLQTGGRIQAGTTAGLDLTLASNRGITLASGDGGFHVWSGFTLTYGGMITGVGNLTKTDGGTWVFTGTADHTGTTSLALGTTVLNGATISSTSSLRVGTTANTSPVTLNINAGTSITTGRLVLNDQAATIPTVNQSGGEVNITGTSNANDNTASFLFGHYGGASATYNLSGGTLNSLGAELSFGWDTTTSLFNQTGGTANLLGLDLGNTRNNPAFYSLNGGRLNLGANGVTTNANKVLNLGGGTLGAFADWTSTQAMVVTGVNGNATVDTQDSVDPLTGRTITLNGALNGTGNLVKTGIGTLTLGGANGLTGALTVNGGTLRIQAGNVRSVPAITVNAGATLQTAATNFFVLDHGAAVAASRLITVDGGTWTMESGDYRLGNVALANGATWTSTPDTAWGILLANNSAGASTVSVSGTSPSVMNGAGALRLQGVQNFAVADVTSSSAADLTISLILRGAGSAAGALGGVNKTGAGTLVLATGVTHDYDGATTINGGTLVVDGTLSASAVTVNNTGTLGGTGTLTQAAVVASGGTVAPGTSVGTLNFGSTLNLNANSTYAVEITGPGTNDKLNVTGALTADGIIKVTLVGHPLALGDTFDIADAAGISGTPTFDFSAAVPPVGTVWNTSEFATSGVIKVTTSTPYDAWATANGVTGGKAGDDDGDGVTNLLEFATNSDAKSASSRARVYGKMHVLGGVNALTYTVAVRKDAVFAPGAPDVSKQEATQDKVKYTVEASNGLSGWSTVTVTELSAADAAAVQAAITPALPTLDADWQWHTFRSDGGAPADGSDFIRLMVAEAP